MPNEKELPLCECGCGDPVAKVDNRFIHGHNSRGDGNPAKRDDIKKKIRDNHARPMLGKKQSPEHLAKRVESLKGRICSDTTKAAVSKALKGIPRSDKDKNAISKGVKNSDAAKEATDKFKGGLDLIWHHVAYDLLRPEALRVMITRKFHSQIHHPKGMPVTERGYSLID